eukprot:315544_1
MDGLHVYFFHCFEVGLRIKNKEDSTENMEAAKAHIYRNTNQHFDETFSRINRLVSKTNNFTNALYRFRANSHRFKIKTGKKMAENTTCLDALFASLKVDNVDIQLIKTFIQFVISEEYDTDCIQYEFEDCDDMGIGNVSNYIQNRYCICKIDEYFKSYNGLTPHHDISITFYYWNYYQSIQDVPDSTCNMRRVFVNAKYISFKAEISSYKYFDYQQYTYIAVKAAKYEKSQIIKSIKAVYIRYLNKYYEIPAGSTLLFDHLLAIILYTDYSELRDDFSSTFSKNTLTETIENITKRNSKYYWLSRRLRECVEIYGQCRVGDYKNNKNVNILSGPFYCSMNSTNTISSVHMKLCSPTSVSKHIEVSVKFIDKEATILQFNNPYSLQTKYLRCFDVSWISRYKEEDERLFFNSDDYIKIQSVLLISTNQNFQIFMNSLHYLDWIINGGPETEMDDSKNNKTDLLMISNLLNQTIKKFRIKTYDSYIHSTFISFIQHKKEIILDLSSLKYIDYRIRELIMYSLDEKDCDNEIERDDNDFKNLFRPELFVMFKNVKRVVVKTTSVYGSVSYSLSMMTLLSLIESNGLNEVIVKAVIFRGYDWINNMWSLSSGKLQKMYQEKQYSILMQQVNWERWIIIKKSQ